MHVDRSVLRVIDGRSVVADQAPADPVRFQNDCLDAYLASWTARGFSPVTIENDTGLLERTLTLLGRPAWEVTVEDVDKMVGDLAAEGLLTVAQGADDAVVAEADVWVSKWPRSAW